MTPEQAPVNEPEIVQMPAQKMAAVYARGRPDKVLPRVLPALVNSLCALKFDLSVKGGNSFPIGRVRTRFPDAHLLPVEEWTMVIGLPVPEATDSLPQQVGGVEIKIETWEYGTVAQITHRGKPSPGEPAAARLHRFIVESGHEIIGIHEEEYAGDQDTGFPETVIRYRVKRK